MQNSVDIQSEVVVDKIRHYLITALGRTLDEATDEEFYHAFCWALREEIMVNWTASMHSIKNAKCRRVYYLSMEHMPGKLLKNNVTNICQVQLVCAVLQKLSRNLASLMHIEPEIGIGNGGLGRLASCLMDSLATQKYPALGYGMRYEYGIFEQELWFGVQVERPDCWLLHQNPWTFRRDANAAGVQYGGNIIEKQNDQGELIHAIADYDEVRALPYDFPVVGYSKEHDFNVLTLRLWSTKESPRNFQLQRYNAGQLDEAAENTSLTDVLYPNDNNEMGKRVRLKQEFLLVSASLQDIIKQHLEHHGDIKDFADKVRIQLNDTHPTLMYAELVRVLMHDFHYKFDEAEEATRTVCSYTNHTVLKEALEEWNASRMQELLPRQYHIIERLNENFVSHIRKKYPNDEEKVHRMSILEKGQVKMAHLAIYGSHKVNGVAKLHSEILTKAIFPDFSEMYPDKFMNVTNGVTQRRWLLLCNPRLSEFITQRIGDGWITNFPEIAKLKEFAKDPASQEEFLKIKAENKQKLIDLLKEQTAKRHCQACELDEHAFLDNHALFDVHIKRFHEYKRQFMNALHAVILYHELKENPNARKTPRLIVFGGKAAPGYLLAKNIIRFIYCLSRKVCADPDVNSKLRIAMVENYNVSKAEIIIPAADLSQQISTAGMEASGTGNMKLAINGALTIGTNDGANVEMREQVTDEWWPFMFGNSAEENLRLFKEKSYTPCSVYNLHPKIKRAVEALRDGSLVENDVEHEALAALHKTILEGHNSSFADRYFVLNDLPAYYETQKKVEELFTQPNKWAEFAMHNIGGMGQFSTDVSIHKYATEIWGIEPCTINPEELKRIRKEFSEHDKCRIFGS